MKLIIKISFLFLTFLCFVRPAISEEIRLKSIGGIHKIPVTLNGVLTLDFIIDTGATDVGLSDEITSRLVRTGAIDKKDLGGLATYTLADGSSVTCRTLLVRSIRLGSREVNNVKACTCPQEAPLLLGQSFWNKIGVTLAFKKKGELVVTFASGKAPEVSTVQTASPPAQVAVPARKAAIPAKYPGCNFEMEKFINAPLLQATNSSWLCYMKQGSQTTAGEFQIFGDGTGFDGPNRLSWKRTGCHSISIATTSWIKASWEDISGDVKYGIVTFTIPAVPQASVVCVLQDVKIAARSLSQNRNPTHDTSYRAPEKFLGAAEAHRKAAEQGDVRAQYVLGVMYESGSSVSKDLAKAFEWYNKAAMQGLAEAQNNLGGLYRSGAGVSRNLSKALDWYQKSAAQGYDLAQYNLGVMYYNGEGTPKKISKAFELFQKAAAQGHAGAQYNLGVMYSSGNGVPEDFTKAAEWYQKAAAQGLADAQAALQRLMGK